MQRLLDITGIKAWTTFSCRNADGRRLQSGLYSAKYGSQLASTYDSVTEPMQPQVGCEMSCQFAAHRRGLHQCKRPILIPCIFNKTLSLQVAADTVLFTPVYVAAFFAFMNSMEGGNLEVNAPHAYSTGIEMLSEDVPLRLAVCASGCHLYADSPSQSQGCWQCRIWRRNAQRTSGPPQL